MDKEEFTKHIKDEINNGQSILQDFHALRKYSYSIGDGLSSFGSCLTPKYDEEERERITNELTLWERRVYEFLKAYLGDEPSSQLDEFKLSKTDIWSDFKKIGIRCMNNNLTTLRSYLERIDLLKLASENMNAKKAEKSPEGKPYKVFISHSGEDRDFVEALVNLLEYLGVKGTERLLCTSIPGYQIPASEDFAEYILRQFYEYKLYVIMVLSKNYYSSACCLNEMGAVWVLKTDFCPILMKGFDYTDMEGFIKDSIIALKVDAEDAKARLNELKNKLLTMFKLEKVNDSRWEKLRDEFLEKVNANLISNKHNIVDLFSPCYLPIFEQIFSLVDMPNYSEWTYYWGIAGKPKIYINTLKNLEKLRDFLLRINYHKEYEAYNSLLMNLGQLVSDYINVSNEHLVSFGKDAYTIEPFYKKIPHDPNYDFLLNKYKEYCFLIADLTLEMTRLLNYILEKIREKAPEFHIKDGVLIVASINREYVEYQPNEKNENPYPGLKSFVIIRASRNKYYSKTTSLEDIL